MMKIAVRLHRIFFKVSLANFCSFMSSFERTSVEESKDVKMITYIKAALDKAIISH